jgi:putative transcriptional regulator
MKNVSPSYLKHQFLIAMPHMADPNFAHTLTYIVEHTANGAMGLVVNRPQELNLADILEQLRPDIAAGACQHVPIYIGGPVQTDRGFVLHPTGRPSRPPWSSKAICRCPPPRTCCSPSPTASARKA